MSRDRSSYITLAHSQDAQRLLTHYALAYSGDYYTRQTDEFVAPRNRRNDIDVKLTYY